MATVPVPAAVERVEGCRPGTIPASVFASGVPLLLKGLVAEWPAVTECSRSIGAATRYLSGFWIDQPVTVYLGDAGIDGRFFYNDDFSGFNFRSGTAHLAQVLQKLAEQHDSGSPAAIYVGSTTIDTLAAGFPRPE